MADLTSDGAVLVVSTYELGHQPVMAGRIAACLTEGGYLPAVVDVAVDRLSDACAAAAELVLVTVPMHTALRLGVRVADRVRRVNPAAHIAFVGDYAKLNVEHLLAGAVDSVLAGEVVGPPLLDHVQAVAAGSAPPRVSSMRKQACAPPDRSRLPPLARYARLAVRGGEHLAAAVEASRGCKHACRHCPIPAVYDRRVFLVDVPAVLADIAAVVEAGAAHVTFADPDFLNAPKHAVRVAAALHERWPALTFDFTAKVEHLLAHADVLPSLVGFGARFVVSAVESLSDHVLEILDKGHSAADVLAALHLTRSVALPMRPTFVAFTPWTSRADYAALVDFILDEDLVAHVDPVQLSVRLLMPPGSLLVGHPAVQAHLGPLVPDGFSWTWRHPDPAMDALHAQVSKIVATAAGAAKPAAHTFQEIRDAVAGRAHDTRLLAVLGSRADTVPRLTEPWFC